MPVPGSASAQFQTSPHGASSWTNLGAADATSPYGVTWNTTTYADGQYDLRVITTDKSGNTFTSAAVMAEVQNEPPPRQQCNCSTARAPPASRAGRPIVATFSETLRVSTMCSTWSGDFSDQTLAALGDVTVTLADGGVANDTVTVTSASCTFHFGTVNLGSTAYATGGNVTFSGSTTADRSTITWNATNRTLTITLGHRRERAPPAPSRAARRPTRQTPRSRTASAPRSPARSTPGSSRCSDSRSRQARRRRRRRVSPSHTRLAANLGTRVVTDW